MDVRCSRCGVAYEFDDAKVPPAGVTVKCSSCEHVFKVKPPSSEAEAPAPSPAVPNVEGWMVRLRDGTLLRFRELTTLQKWIVEQRVTSADEISRTGRAWRPLGDIAELASFFEVVAAANAARQAAALERTAPVEVLAPASGSLSTPAVGPSAAPEAFAAAKAPAVPLAAETSFYGDALEGLDDEDPVAAWKRRARLRNAALALLALILSGIAGTYFFARPTFERVLASVSTIGGNPSTDAPDADAAVSSTTAAKPSEEPSPVEAAVLKALATAATAKDDAAREQAIVVVEQALAKAPGDKRLEEVLATLRASSASPLVGKAAEGSALVDGGTADDKSEDANEGKTDSKTDSKTDFEAASEGKEPSATEGTAAATASSVRGEGSGSSDDGESYEELIKRAESARVRERTSTALALYKKAAELRPDATRPHVGMGWCYLDLERTRQAADAFAHAISLDKDLAEAHFGLGETMRMLGNKAAALRAYKRYLTLAPMGPDAPMARNAIRSLEESP